MVLNTNAAAGPSPTSGAGPSSAMKWARRSMPMSWVALPHSTGNTLASLIPFASATSSSCTSIGSSAR